MALNKTDLHRLRMYLRNPPAVSPEAREAAIRTIVDVAAGRTTIKALPKRRMLRAFELITDENAAGRLHELNDIVQTRLAIERIG